MQLDTLKPKTKNKSRKRVGRSGAHGKTSGRGHKGQKSRAGHRIRPAVRDTIKRLPKRRGRGTNQQKRFTPTPVVVNLASLELNCAAGDEITPHTLLKKRLIQTRGKHIPTVKILGQGTLTKKLAVSGCSVSASARKHIEKVGGTIH